jgi:hypothetical protein
MSLNSNTYYDGDGVTEELAKLRFCLAFLRILPNRICIAHVTFSKRC